ncbi:ketopantoate reductase family protein [Shewanella intestini]|uniref:2-dehydropantoate 2-reductase n=1 Tax=Shewanella intestini TaxID=2017544 RepID=A0ABS5I633_9GAMM|nr:2-dehydropantoate 2-reductase [Shewanella sp. XMDDZSB0408]MBR9729480.1 2-dehydropantoate 2-reductase [Shewanella intestini]MRG35059.1 2-dehydropantoate 2-reductase [Shewanella sp. XMDDZSB0408]
MTKSTSTITILGAGAIGQLLYRQCSSQINAAIDVQLLVKQHSTSTQTALVFDDIEGHRHQYNGHVISLSDNDLSARLASTQLLIVCVKAYQVNNALNNVINALPGDCHVLLLHNGMGPHLTVANILAPFTGMGLSIGTTSQAALKHSQWHIEQTGNGLTTIGHIQGTPIAPQLMQLLNDAIPALALSDNILNALWKKLVINCAINPLTAIEQCRNGQLSEKQYQTRINAIIEECVTVAKADDVVINLTEMQSIVAKVIASTANNYSSMRQDIHFQRPTEIQQINGYVVSRAAKHQLNVPVNQKMVNKIIMIETLQHS